MTRRGTARNALAEDGPNAAHVAVVLPFEDVGPALAATTTVSSATAVAVLDHVADHDRPALVAAISLTLDPTVSMWDDAGRSDTLVPVVLPTSEVADSPTHGRSGTPPTGEMGCCAGSSAIPLLASSPPEVDTAYWWVDQGQTFEGEFLGSYRIHCCLPPPLRSPAPVSTRRVRVVDHPVTTSVRRRRPLRSAALYLSRAVERPTTTTWTLDDPDPRRPRR